MQSTILHHHNNTTQHLIQRPLLHDPGLHSITKPNGTLASSTITGLYNRHVSQKTHEVDPVPVRNGTTTWASSTTTGNGHICSPKPVHQGASKDRESRPPLWHRPLGYCEKLMTSAHNYGCMTTVYALWLESKRVVEFDLIKQASYVVSRKMPHLRMVVGRREGQLWWREMETTVLDLEEVIADNLDQVEPTLESLLRRQYNVEEGPLWFVRFLSPTTSIDTDPNQNHKQNINHNKYKYVCIFGFHHNVSDGTTNMSFCRVFLKVLNDLMQGNTIDLTEAGTFASPLHDRLADEASSQWTLFCMFLKRFYRAVISYGAHVSNFTQVFRMPAEIGAGTRVLHHQLDEITSRRLYLRCKMEGVTVNSAFTAAANLACTN
ncbi:hypothetical protein Pmani_011129 [Petrolisthes manimaculis]|uniref:Alcohol acetyltransferase n=1 Tax=Petrolisthes manimaculis TaxID=1843537 RepID=A0AAE1PZX1_9EUCA|nr:hypothetical protein Pmani_011129 [Petrolisthes manimaculis]